MVRIGLLGCGNVGHLIATNNVGIEIAALFDRINERAHALNTICHASVFENFESFIQGDYPIVVEAASVEAVREFGVQILQNGKDIIILSVGALADVDFKSTLIETARKNKKRIYIPSGAIVGLDNLKVGQIAGMNRLILRTTKSPASLNIPVKERMLIFKGKANDCIRQFPKNINVAVALSLAAGRDADVEIWVDPSAERNVHEILAEGTFGDISIKVSNVPSLENPATSYLAALSILTLLKNLDSPLVIGT